MRCLRVGIPPRRDDDGDGNGAFALALGAQLGAPVAPGLMRRPGRHVAPGPLIPPRPAPSSPTRLTPISPELPRPHALAHAPSRSRLTPIRSLSGKTDPIVTSGVLVGRSANTRWV